MQVSMRLLLLAVQAKAAQLQPMAGDLVTVVFTDNGKLLFCFKAIKIGAATASGTNQQVLVAARTSKYRLALAEMMDPVDQFQFFELFNRTVNCHQADVRHNRACLVENFHGGKRAVAGRDNIQDYAPRPGDTIPAAAELALPIFGCL